MNDWITPDWPAPPNVKALFTTRNGGVSHAPYASLNLGGHVGDDTGAVEQNRALLRRFLPAEPRWLNQVHGTSTISIDRNDCTSPSCGDAAFSQRSRHVCAILVADCLPILLCDQGGTTVGALHGGWRGLAGGIVEQAISAMGADPASLMAWLGPAIGPGHFEVGEEVHLAFTRRDEEAALAFHPGLHKGKWYADLFLLARQQLKNAGITQVYGGGECTFSDPAQYFSYRRDGSTGRMGALIWLV
jgi:YfiH family protein